MTRRTDCPECGAPLETGAQTCPRCGAPLSFSPGDPDGTCATCGEAMPAYAERCPACGETGYPALRPRRGKDWKGAPDGASTGSES